MLWSSVPASNLPLQSPLPILGRYLELEENAAKGDLLDNLQEVQPETLIWEGGHESIGNAVAMRCVAHLAENYFFA